MHHAVPDDQPSFSASLNTERPERTAGPPTGPCSQSSAIPWPARRSRLIPATSSCQTRDILLVEDDADLAAMLLEELRSEGYAVDVAGSGEQGLDALQHARYRLLLLDLVMPGIGGMQMLDALRVRPGPRPDAVLILSTRSHSSHIRDALAAGADDYLTKPMELEDLLLRVRLWMDRAVGVATAAGTGLRIYSLGRFCVERTGTVCLHTGSRARKATTLFKYLLTRHARVVPAGEVFSLLWPDAPEDAASADLRSLLHQLRRSLGLTDHGEMRLEHTGATLALHLGPRDWWDVAEFDACLGEAARRVRAGDVEEAITSYKASLLLYAGDYLGEDTYATWAVSRREQLRQDWLHALAELARLYGASGQHVEQEVALRTIVCADPYREDSQRALMTLLAELGRSAEALVLYRELEERLRAEFHAHPDPKTQAVAQHIGQCAHVAARSL